MARPPRLPEATILTLIEELRSQDAALTGTTLRAELKAATAPPAASAASTACSTPPRCHKPHPLQHPPPPPTAPLNSPRP